MQRLLPVWFEQEFPGKTALNLARSLKQAGLHTVCCEAKCPNINACFKKNEATFLILGNTCTRKCLFCAVKKSTGKTKLGLDKAEPWRVAEAAKQARLSYVVITSVTRDDLSDGGAGIFAETIKAIRALNNGNIKIEALIPDNCALRPVISAGPNVLGHNIETISRLYKLLRPQANYKFSLGLLSKAKKINPRLITKSSVMLGLGERTEEIRETMKDLRASSCDILTLGQYLSVSDKHYPVKEFITPEQFKEYENIALSLGFKAVLSGPLVRSSYKAQDVYNKLEHI